MNPHKSIYVGFVNYHFGLVLWGLKLQEGKESFKEKVILNFKCRSICQIQNEIKI